MFDQIAALSVALVPLAACGGGGSPAAETGPAINPPDPTLIVVVDQGSDNSGATEVRAYLEAHATDGLWYAGPDSSWSHEPGLTRFWSPQTVRMVEGTTAGRPAMSIYTVATVKRWLPYDRHVQTGADFPASQLTLALHANGRPLHIGNIPDGQIVIDSCWPDGQAALVVSLLGRAMRAAHPGAPWDWPFRLSQKFPATHLHLHATD